MSESKKFVYRRHREDTHNEHKIEVEEFLRDGPKGLTFRFKTLDKKSLKYSI